MHWYPYSINKISYSYANGLLQTATRGMQHPKYVLNLWWDFRVKKTKCLFERRYFIKDTHWICEFPSWITCTQKLILCQKFGDFSNPYCIYFDGMVQQKSFSWLCKKLRKLKAHLSILTTINYLRKSSIGWKHKSKCNRIVPTPCLKNQIRALPVLQELNFEKATAKTSSLVSS